MDKLTKILAYVDTRPQSIASFRQAAMLARYTGASIRVMDVLTEPSQWVILPTVRQLSAECRAKELEELVAPFRTDGLEISVEVRVGKPTVELIRAVIRDGHDLVVKAAKGSTGRRLSPFGTTAMHLIRKCPCPVWLVGPNPIHKAPKVLAAVDPGPAGDALSMGLAEKLIAHAQVLAGSIGGEHHVVHAWHLPNEDLVRPHIAPAELDQLVAAQETATKARMRTLLRSVDDLPSSRVHLRKGAPEEIVPAFSDAKNFDLIVLGSIGRSGISGLLIGEMAEEILSRVECSVLCVKPDGFVSPIRAAVAA